MPQVMKPRSCGQPGRARGVRLQRPGVPLLDHRAPGRQARHRRNRGPEIEYADFALRHVMRAIEQSGFPWCRERLPAYWGSYAGLTSLRVFPKPDPQMMALITSRDAGAALIGKTAALAVRHLGLPLSRFHDWLEMADTVS